MLIWNEENSLNTFPRKAETERLRNSETLSAIHDSNIVWTVHSPNYISAIHDSNIVWTVHSPNYISAIHDSNIVWTVHSPNNIKVVNAQEAKVINTYMDIKYMLLKTNAKILFNKTCKQLYLAPIYVQFHMSDTNMFNIISCLFMEIHFTLLIHFEKS
jgi:hypothetical protein